MLRIHPPKVQPIAPSLLEVLKFDPSEPRDPHGRWTTFGASIRVGDREIAVVKPARARDDQLVPLNVVAFDTEFQREQGFYLGVGGIGGIGTRYQRFGDFIASHDSIEAAEVSVQENGRVGFTNGRHRYAWLRDQGLTTIPVAMTPESVRNAKKHGYLAAVKLAWDESQPRDAKGRWAKGSAEPPPVGPRIGFVGPDGKEHVGRKTGGLGGYSEDHTDTARRLLDKEYSTALSQAQARGGDYPNAIRLMLEQGAIRYWVRNGEIALHFQAGHPKTVEHVIQFLHDNFQDGDRIYIDIEGAEPHVHFFDNVGAANRTIRQTKPLKKVAQEHSYGNTQIQIAPTSAAALSLNMARAAIRDEHCMATGKDVDPNHVTVRFGLLNDDLDGLRSFIVRQQSFEAEVGEIELFPASEHSDGAVPVVARIVSPELHAIEAEIGQYADFKDKNFPEYKPHCTLAYVHPDKADYYRDLFVNGSFVVQSITISHASGVQETIPFGMAQKWDVTKRDGKSTRFHNRPHWAESLHPRQPAGSSRGGEFMSTLHGPRDALDSLLNKEKNVSIDRNDVRRFLELAGEQLEDPDLTDLQVEGMEIFGGNGLGIKRDQMPQIPREHRQRFLRELVAAGVKITEESVDPLTLKPTQKEISARRVMEKITKYETKNKAFPPLLVSLDDRVLDGHHHWGMMAAFALDVPEAKVPIFRLHIKTKAALSMMHAYMRKHHIKRASITGEKIAADPVTGRYVTPFVSFEKQGDEQLRMIASLNSSRLATWGFTAEAEVLGMARYKLTAVLDGRTSKFCRMINGHIFDVPDARRKVIEALNVQDPNDLKTVQPWPKQTKEAMAEYAKMSPQDFVDRGLHIPPYHPHCRTLLRHVQSSAGKATEPPVPTLPDDTEVFHPITQADLKELGVEATPEEVAWWNSQIGMSPTELIAKLTGMPPQEILTKGKGIGANPIRFDEGGAGNIGVRARGELPSGVEFAMGAILDPFTGIFYLSEAALEVGTPAAEISFLKNLFSEMINTGLRTSATEVAVGVAGNAAYYAKLGFLPDDLEWETLRTHTLTELESGGLQEMFQSLAPLDQELVKHLLQDQSASALSALVDLPFTYEGRTFGEWMLEDAGGTWGLDLTDEAVVNQAKAYLS